MRVFAQDLKHALRLLAKNPGATIVAVTALALGIGGCTAIFGVVNAVLLRPLPYRQPEGILRIFGSAPSRSLDLGPLSYQRFETLLADNRVFDSFGAYTVDSVDLTGVAEPVQLTAARASSGVFETLGVRPALGRAFLPGEDGRGAAPVAVLSDGLWRRRFASDPAIVGRAIQLGGASTTVVGVMPAGFAFPDPDVELYLSRIFEPNFLTSGAIDRGSGYLDAIARRKAGTTDAALRVDLERLAASDPRTSFLDADLGYRAVSLTEQVVGSIRPTLLLFACAVGFVLLIACANVANVLLARAVDRRGEVAVRAAIGATRARLLRQFLTESLLLAIPAGLIGVLVAFWGSRILAAAASESVPRAAEIGLDGRVLAVTTALTLATALLAGLAPALHAAHVAPSASLRDARGHSASGRRGSRTRGALVVLEVALSVVLLVGAGLLLESFARLSRAGPGFDDSDLVVARIRLPGGRYAEAARIREFLERAVAEAAALPGVVSVAAGEALPPAEAGQTPLAIDGRPAPPIGERDLVALDTVTPDYFRTLGIPLLAGRTFTTDDGAKAPIKVIVSRAFTKKYFAGESPLGRRVLLGRGPTGYEIVGEVGDVKNEGLEAAPAPLFYLTASQRPIRSFSLVLRTRQPLAAVGAVLRARITAIDPDQPIASLQTLDQALDSSLAARRFVLGVVGVFAALAVALAAIGIYGVLSYTVSRRTPEIGVRLALGAQRREVVALVMRESLVLALAGAAVGLAAAFALTRFMEGMLYGIGARDPWTFASMAMVAVAAALAAGYAPALRAARLDPTRALKYE